ncbi:MAG: hypothetical protein EAX96_01910 [Candidatus Lokiarchaeota archaeon]|nr:hypothetical protein [Candidatus Lokiarchaeota archaeon]
MKELKWQFLLGISLILISIIVYFIHFIIFQDLHHILIYLIGDIAFVPIEVLMVTLILHQLLSMREKKAILKKLNMVIGAFFSEIGIYLLKKFSEFDPKVEELRNKLLVKTNWEIEDFIGVKSFLKNFDCSTDCKTSDLEKLKEFLKKKRTFLLALLENPNLLEHETFTELLWAVFHLMEELEHRDELISISQADYQHLTGDIKRVYSLLIAQWLSYMEHLKSDYPYLFSLAMRTNPFDLNASVQFT